jgi:putative phosphoesterase
MSAITKAVGVFNDAEVSRVLHAGDLVAPFVSKPLANLKADLTAVFGNNDGERFGLAHVFQGKIYRPPHLLNIEGNRILLLHEPDNLKALADSEYFDVIIYGHTHDVDIQRGKTLVINPGECGGWLRGRRTVALWDTQTNDVEILPV